MSSNQPVDQRGAFELGKHAKRPLHIDRNALLALSCPGPRLAASIQREHE